MQHDATPTRRSVVTAAGVATLGVAGIGTLAACGSSSSATTDAAASEDAAAGTTAASVATSAAASAGSGGSAATPIAKLSDVPVGGAIAAILAGAKIIVAQPSAGKVVAFSAICTHAGCTVAPSSASLVCPCHGSTFDTVTGAVTKGPATAALPAVTVALDGDNIVPA